MNTSLLMLFGLATAGSIVVAIGFALMKLPASKAQTLQALSMTVWFTGMLLKNHSQLLSIILCFAGAAGLLTASILLFKANRSQSR